MPPPPRTLFFVMAAIAFQSSSVSAQSCQYTCGTGALSTALGYHTAATSNLAVAFGFNTTASGATSFAMGVSTRAFSDTTVPGGSSCGACIATGQGTTAIGDYSSAHGQLTTSRGYASFAMGEGTVANTFGELALGLYTENEPVHTETELKNQSVIPTWDPNDVVLRVGVGCSKALPGGGVGCKEDFRMDAMRVYKSGTLYLKKTDGTMIPDVQGAIEQLQEQVAALTAHIDYLENNNNGMSSGAIAALVIASVAFVIACTAAVTARGSSKAQAADGQPDGQVGKL